MEIRVRTGIPADLVDCMIDRAHDDGLVDDNNLSLFLFPVGNEECEYSIMYRGSTISEGRGTRDEISLALSSLRKALKLEH